MKATSGASPLRLGLFLISFLLPLAALGCGKKINPHSVTVTWIASKSRIRGYNVYRLSSSSTVPVKLSRDLVPGTDYTDRTAEAGRTYTYYVTSVDSTGRESKPSEMATVTVPVTLSPPTSSSSNPPAKP